MGPQMIKSELGVSNNNEKLIFNIQAALTGNMNHMRENFRRPIYSDETKEQILHRIFKLQPDKCTVHLSFRYGSREIADENGHPLRNRISIEIAFI